MPPSSPKTQINVRIKIIHGDAWQEVFHARYKATYLKAFYAGLHGHKSSNQFRSLWILTSPVLHWIWSISYLVTMPNSYWQWLTHNSFSYFLKSKDKSFLLFHYSSILKIFISLVKFLSDLCFRTKRVLCIAKYNTALILLEYKKVFPETQTMCSYCF